MPGGLSSDRSGDSAQLYAMEGPDQGVTFVLDKPQIVVGRSRSCDVVLIDPSVSRQHFQVEPRGRNLHLKNLSTKGTRVNGALVEETLLGDGDVVSLGETALKVMLKAATASPKPAAPAAPRPSAGLAEPAPDLAFLSSVLSTAASEPEESAVLQRILAAALESCPGRAGIIVHLRPGGSEAMLAAGTDDLAPKIKAQAQAGSPTWRRRVIDLALTSNPEIQWTQGPPLGPGLGSEDLVAQGIRSLVAQALSRGPSGKVLLYLEAEQAGAFSRIHADFLKALAAGALGLLSRGEAAASAPTSREGPAEAPPPFKGSPLPRAKGWFAASRFLPASPPRGDFLEFAEGRDGGLVVILGSVSGSGLSRGLAAASARSALKLSAQRAQGPAESLRWANALFKQDFPPGIFVSAAVFWMDSESRRVLGANAGFGPCYVYRTGPGVLDKFHPKGIGMNIGPASLFDGSLEEEAFPLGDGDVILAFSDGLTESSDARNEPLGENRLRTWLERGATSAEDFMAKIEREWRIYTGKSVPQDDILMLALALDRRRGPRGESAGSYTSPSAGDPGPAKET